MVSASASASGSTFDVNALLQRIMGDVASQPDTVKKQLKEAGEVDVKLKHLFLRNAQLIDICMALRNTRSIELTDCIFEPGVEDVLNRLLRLQLPKLDTIKLKGRVFKETDRSGNAASQPNGRNMMNLFEERVRAIKMARDFLQAEATGNSIIFQDILKSLVGSAENQGTLSFQAYLEREGFFEAFIEEAPVYAADSDVNLALRVAINAGELNPIEVPPPPPPAALQGPPPPSVAPQGPPAASSSCTIC